MKVYQIVSESSEVKEAPMGALGGAFKKAKRYFGSQSAAGELDVGNEANDLKKKLQRFMGGAGIKKGKLTLDQLEDFLNKAGYGGIAKGELDKVRQQSAARLKKIQNVGQKVGAGVSAAKAGFNTAKDTYKQRAPSESVNEAEGAALSNSDIDKVLIGVVKQSYAKNVDVKKGKFANKSAPAGSAPASAPTAPASKPKLPADVVQMLSKLSPEQRTAVAAALGTTSGSKTAPTAKASAPTSAAAAPAGKASLAKGTTKTGPDGVDYVWMGAAWKNTKTGKIAKRDIGQQLSASA